METALAIIEPQIEQSITHLVPHEDLRKRFAAVLVSQLRTNLALQKCTQESIMAAVIKMAQLNLDPSIPNECFLVPFKGEAAFVLGYGGLRKLALRSQEVRDIFVAVVRENDIYESPESPISLPYHKRPGKFAPRGKAIGYYAAALLKAGHWRVVEMSREEIKQHRDTYSRSAGSTFWNEGKPDATGDTNFDKMAMKTVLRQLCSTRSLSLSAEISQVFANDEGGMHDSPREESTPHMYEVLPRETTIQRGAVAAQDIFGGSQGMQQRYEASPVIEMSVQEKEALIKYIYGLMRSKNMSEERIDTYCQQITTSNGVSSLEDLDQDTLRALAKHIEKWPVREVKSDGKSEEIRDGSDSDSIIDTEEEKLPF